jgi:hypothetical protein
VTNTLAAEATGAVCMCHNSQMSAGAYHCMRCYGCCCVNRTCCGSLYPSWDTLPPPFPHTHIIDCCFSICVIHAPKHVCIV